LKVRQHSTDPTNSVFKAHIQHMSTSEVTVWYDGACPLCIIEISLFKRLDAKHGRIAFVDLMGDGACPLDRGTLLEKFHAQETGQPIVSGMVAFGLMWQRVTPFQPLGWLTKWRPTLWIMDKLYVQFLRVRPKLQVWMRTRQRTS
jgi:predicted DCC family thiol-disulfide oxidoreductase YuxK